MRSIAALALVDVVYESLPAVADFDSALAHDAPELFPEAPMGIVPGYGQGASGELVGYLCFILPEERPFSTYYKITCNSR